MTFAPACGCDRYVSVQSLLPIDDALQRTRDLPLPALEAETIAIGDANGRVACENVTAAHNVPRFSNSAMDGYAVRWSDCGDGAVLPVTGTVAAGGVAGRLEPGRATQIFTGAPLPDGADTVVPQEDVTIAQAGIRPIRNPARQDHVRFAGEDVAKGAEMLRAGDVMSPHRIAGLVMVGVDRIPVFRKPRVRIIATGDEIRPAGTDLKEGQIWDCNTPMLWALIHETGLFQVDVLHVQDSQDALDRAIADAISACDLVLTTGGASVGDRDHIHDVMNRINAQTVFAGVAVKPGKPVALFDTGAAPVLAMPGNPYAAFCLWHLLGRGLFHRLRGGRNDLNITRQVHAECATENLGPREQMRPARIARCDAGGMPIVAVLDMQSSASMAQVAKADGLVRVPHGKFSPGSQFTIYPFGGAD